jgi:hypothetical protein
MTAPTELQQGTTPKARRLSLAPVLGPEAARERAWAEGIDLDPTPAH